MTLVLVVKCLVGLSSRLNQSFLYNPLSIFILYTKICSLSYPTQQYCFNFISGYKTPIEVNPVGSVHKIHGRFTVKNSEF